MSEMIKVKSLSLLKEINKNKCLGLLKEIREDRQDDKHRPIYIFLSKPSLLDVVNRFVAEYGADDRNMDGDLWDQFDADVFYSDDKSKSIVTSNYYIIDKIFDAGRACNLCGSFWDKRGRHVFAFAATDEIREIKTLGDQESNRLYENRVKAKERSENE